jgi:hypothetical protein
MLTTRKLYSSPNGDTWALERNAAGEVTVLHEANRASGGTRTRFQVEDFLARTAASPEKEALLRFLRD